MQIDSQPSPQGLSEEEARSRLLAEGANSMPDTERQGAAAILREVVEEPMVLLLLASGILYLVLGDLKEGLVLFAFATLSVVITVVQEFRTEKVLRTLTALSSPSAHVIRDGQRRRVPGADVVRGDLIVIDEGGRVPADATLVQCHDLLADEALLTGESVPVRKTARTGADGDARPGGEDRPFVFSGSLIVRGSGIAEVTATGPRSALGRIGALLGLIEREPPRLRQQMARMVRMFASVGVAVSLLTLLLYGVTRGNWTEAILAGIAIGMAMLPEELPVLLAVFMAMGAWRISKAKVLTRKAAAIEALGSATVLCTDKTGTLTQNRMSLSCLRRPDGQRLEATHFQDADAAGREILRTAILASAPNATDPMERAFHDAGRSLPPTEGKAELVRAFGLRPDLLAVTHIWRLPGSHDLMAAAKGAPESIADLCALSPDARARLHRAVEDMAAEGLRVLAIARGQWNDSELPASPREITFDYLGLAGLTDPVRTDVPEAVRSCQAAGIRVVMITGDYPATASAIARQAGLVADSVVTGRDLEGMSSDQLSATVARSSVFARVLPEQKLKIVQALKQNGEIVAMTGDGVNDAPSLKAAHIGIAMGERGTEVAREAASIVLLDDSFTSIATAISLGRRIYDNIRKAIGFVFAVHVPIAGLALLPLIAGLPPLLGPAHIAFLEMIIDPVCSLVFEAERAEPNVMQRPPRAPDEPLFSADLVLWGLGQGVVALLVVIAVFFVAVQRAMPESEIRAICFFALVTCVLGLVLVNRSFGASVFSALSHPTLAFCVVLTVVISVLTASLAIPAVADLFRFGPLHADDLAIVLTAATLMVMALEGIKMILPKPGHTTVPAVRSPRT